MGRYIAGRLLQSLIVLTAATTAVFLMTRLSGNPALLLAPPGSTPEQIRAISESLGLEEPLPVQFARFVVKLAQGDLGNSLKFGAPVREVIVSALPNTAVLAFAAFAFATVFGVSAGTLAALKSGTWIDSLVRGVAVAGQSLPSFWLGLLFIMFFAVQLRLLPSFGSGTLLHLIMPALVLGMYPLAAISRLTRSAVLEVLRADFIVFERSKGVGQRTFLSHLLRNAALPLVTLLGIQLGTLLGGAVIVETLFAWPGIGLLAIQAVNGRDYNMVQGVAIVGTAIFVLLNLLVDISYAWLDPRIRRP